MTGPAPPADASPLLRRLDELADCTAEHGIVTRLYLTPEHRAAALMVARWMRLAGMETTLDAAGNVVGRYEAAKPGAPSLLIGSHIDTVRNAGKYDGPFGVVAAIQAVAELYARGKRLDFAIEVLAFGDEEGVRFPTTLIGSRAIAGTLDPAVLDSVDRTGVSVRAALAMFGGRPDAILSLGRRPKDVLAYIELHIEQGPVLEEQDLPVGIVTAINGASRLTVELGGMAGHAGTVPMRMRRDAGAAMAEMVLAVERLALTHEDIVATVGRIEIMPGAVNVIPGGARFSIDLRSSDDTLRASALSRLGDDFAALATRRGVTLDLRTDYVVKAARCAPAMIAALEKSVARCGVRPYLLPSGAGHDGLAIIDLCPIAMLFLRCEGGISHNPAESIRADDADLAVRVLLDFLLTFNPVTLGPGKLAPTAPLPAKEKN